MEWEVSGTETLLIGLLYRLPRVTQPSENHSSPVTGSRRKRPLLTQAGSRQFRPHGRLLPARRVTAATETTEGAGASGVGLGVGAGPKPGCKGAPTARPELGSPAHAQKQHSGGLSVGVTRHPGLLTFALSGTFHVPLPGRPPSPSSVPSLPSFSPMWLLRAAIARLGFPGHVSM